MARLQGCGMSYSNNAIHSVKNDHATELSLSGVGIITFDFFDGIESGLICYPDGTLLSIKAIAESPSRLFRAFVLSIVQLEGEDYKISKDFLEDLLHQKTYKSSDWDKLKIVESQLSKLDAIGFFLGVAPIGLDRIALISTDKKGLDNILALGGNLRFQAVQNLIKG